MTGTPHDHHLELSAAAVDYLVALRNIASSGEAAPSSAGLARRLGVSPQAASEMLRKLVADGLLESTKELRLTEHGRSVADGLFRRHALMEWLLTDVVGMGWAESDVEAHRLMAAVSERVMEQLDTFLGHPDTCPHGNPIDGTISARRPPGVPLDQVPSGGRVTIYRITEEAEEDAALLSYLEARGLRPGTPVLVTASSASLGSVTLEGPRGAATLGLGPAHHIRVLPGEPDPALFHRVPRP
ncbi:MAG: metal-dependent transcriptional regulator [Chloroflexota bacterium]